MSISKTILIVEDDAGVAKFLRELLVDNSFIVHQAKDGISALDMTAKVEPDLVILDLGLPNMNGETVCVEIKKKFPEVPIIILTAKNNKSDIVYGLNIGADDYVTKPFVPEELLARVKARLRPQGMDGEKLRVGDLELNPKTMQVKRNGKDITLTPQEFKLLYYLMSNRGRVLTREMILNRVWLYSPDIESRVVDIYVGYLRKKIDRDFDRKLLKSVRGFGYMLNGEE